jgi:hypothetical protein
LALIFGSPNTTQTWLENLGCYTDVGGLGVDVVDDSLQGKMQG